MKGDTTRKLILKEINQVSVVVSDLAKSMERYWTTFGIGPFYIYTFQPPVITDMTVRGKPAEHSMKVALAQTGAIQLELIQPLGGESIYKEFLNEKGEGIHHLGCVVDNLDEAIATTENQGISVIQSGRFPGGGYAYLDTERTLGTILELVQMPPEMPPPEAIWPETEG